MPASKIESTPFRGRVPLERAGARSVLARVPIVPIVRGLLLLVGVVAVLLASYSALTQRRNFKLTGEVGREVWAERQTVGQTFLSRYPNLSGVEMLINAYGLGSSPSRAALVLHLRASPGPGPDVATATLLPNQTLENFGWHTFQFPPIADSQDKTYYLEIESPGATSDNTLGLYWWRSDPSLPTDAYPEGTAYTGGEPQAADLAFGLLYSPSPVDAWAQATRAASTTFPPLFMLAVGLGVGAFLLWAALWLPRLARQEGGLRRWLLRWSLPFVLAVALLNGLLYMLLTPPWQGPDEHGHFMHAALLDRHALDWREVRDLQWWEGGRDRAEIVELKAAIWASMHRHSWTHLLNGYPTPGSTAFSYASDDIYSEFVWQVRQPPTYYLLCAALLSGARTLGIQVDIIKNPEGALMLMRGVSLLLSLGLVALAWVVGALLSVGRLPWLRLLLPLTVTLLPMHAFVSSTLNNDILAEVAVTALFAVLIALLRRPTGRRGLGLALVVLLLVPLSALSKGTAIVAALPLAGLGLVVWLGMLASKPLARWLASRGSSARNVRMAAPLALVLLFLLMCVGAAALLFRQEKKAVGWLIGDAPDARPTRVRTSASREGEYVIALQPREVAYQWVEFPLPHPPLTVTLSVWARPTENGGAVPPRAGLVVDERGRLPAIGAQALQKVEVWQPITPTVAGEWSQLVFEAPARYQDRKLMVRLAAGDVPTQFDNFTLSARASDESNPGAEGQIGLKLFNPSGETGAWRLREPFGSLLPVEQAHIIDSMVNPQAYDKFAIGQRYAYRQFRSFWGNFGWLSLPLPETIYGIINVVLVVALGGLAWAGVRRAGLWSGREWLGLISLVSLAVGVIMGFARQMASLGPSGVHTDPHGRYLFVFMVPAVWLLLAGAWSAWSLLSSCARRGLGLMVASKGGGRGEVAAPRYLPWGVWLLSYSLLLFGAYTLLALIVPYYYR